MRKNGGGKIVHLIIIFHQFIVFYLIFSRELQKGMSVYKTEMYMLYSYACFGKNFRLEFNPSECELFRNLFLNHSKSSEQIRNFFCMSFNTNRLKNRFLNGWDSLRTNSFPKLSPACYTFSHHLSSLGIWTISVSIYNYDTWI